MGGRVFAPGGGGCCFFFAPCEIPPLGCAVRPLMAVVGASAAVVVLIIVSWGEGGREKELPPCPFVIMGEFVLPRFS